MILTIDVGNTNITCGVFQGDEIAASFRITTKMPRTSDEYGMMLMNLLEQNDIHPAEIKDAIICSVVPNVMHSLSCDHNISISHRSWWRRASKRESAL